MQFYVIRYPGYANLIAFPKCGAIFPFVPDRAFRILKLDEIFPPNQFVPCALIKIMGLSNKDAATREHVHKVSDQRYQVTLWQTPTGNKGRYIRLLYAPTLDMKYPADEHQIDIKGYPVISRRLLRTLINEKDMCDDTIAVPKPLVVEFDVLSEPLVELDKIVLALARQTNVTKE